MIHDAQAEVTCDADGCTEHEYVELSWHLGGYDDSDDRIEQKLIEQGWVVVEGKHYCSVGHASA